MFLLLLLLRPVPLGPAVRGEPGLLPSGVDSVVVVVGVGVLALELRQLDVDDPLLVPLGQSDRRTRLRSRDAWTMKRILKLTLQAYKLFCIL